MAILWHSIHNLLTITQNYILNNAKEARVGDAPSVYSAFTAMH